MLAFGDAFQRFIEQPFAPPCRAAVSSSDGLGGVAMGD